MVKRILAVSGIGNCGKTHTMNYLAQRLETNYPHARMSGPDPFLNPLDCDARYVFDNIKGFKVGIGTSGDWGSTIADHFTDFDAVGCDIVITACRSRSGADSVDELEHQAMSRNVIVDYTTLMWETPSAHQILVEQTIAQRLETKI